MPTLEEVLKFIANSKDKSVLGRLKQAASDKIHAIEHAGPEGVGNLGRPIEEIQAEQLARARGEAK
jgi:hypothetical protein